MKQEDKDELRKSLEGLFTEDEIVALIEKAEIEGKFEDEKKDEGGEKKEEEGEKKDEKTVDEEEQENMKKAYDEIMSKKSELDKSVDAFCDKFGNVPGFTKPADFFVSKSVNNDIEKSFDSKVNDINKAFNEQIEKSFNEQKLVVDEIKKSLEDLALEVKKVSEAPNPLKSLFGKYQFIEKGEKNEDGKEVISLSKDKHKVIDVFVKSLDKVEDKEDQIVIRNMISDFTISNKTNTTGLNIVKKAMDIDFEK